MLLYSGEDIALSHIGYVLPTTTSLLVHELAPAQLPLTVYYQGVTEVGISKWPKEGIIYTLNYTTDFTAFIVLKGLKPSSQYRYSLTNNHTGTFTTEPLVRSELGPFSFHVITCRNGWFNYGGEEAPRSNKLSAFRLLLSVYESDLLNSVMGLGIAALMPTVDQRGAEFKVTAKDVTVLYNRDTIEKYN